MPVPWTPEEALVFLARESHDDRCEHWPFLSGLEAIATEGGFDELFGECSRRGLIAAHLVGYTVHELREYCVRFAAHNHALAHYAAQPISVPIDLFVAEDEAMRQGKSAWLGWEKILPERSIVRVGVPGDHQTIIHVHVAELGKAVTEALASKNSAQPVTGNAAYHPCIAIQNGVPRQAPVFCVPGAGDNISSFLPLSLALGDAWSIYGLQPRGLDMVLEPHATVEAATSAYLRAMEDVVPNGPLHLLGHSFGGWIVFEMALRMAQSGRDVASVTIVDSEPPAVPVQEFTALDVLCEWIRVVELSAEKRLGVERSTLASLDSPARLRLLHERMVQLGLMPRRSDPEALQGSIRVFGTAIRTPYVPQRSYSGSLNLVCIDDRDLDPDANRRLHAKTVSGWSRCAPRLRRWDGPGNHITILKAPHVERLAEWWKTVGSA
jgi:thioesterase domain-containing protein